MPYSNTLEYLCGPDDHELPIFQETMAAFRVGTLATQELAVVPAPEEVTTELQEETEQEAKNRLIRQEATGPLDRHTPDVIFLFSGGMTRDNGTNRTTENLHRATNYTDLTEHGLVTGGRTRVIATAAIARVIPDIPIVTDSYNRFDPTEPTMASVMGQELINRGVDGNRIIHETDSFSTVTQLIEMVNMANEHGWNDIDVIGTAWHFPRVSAMFENLETIVNYEDPAKEAAFKAALATFRERGVRVGFVSSENVMRIISPHYANYLDAAEASAPFQQTLAAETQGLADLQAGKYRIVLKAEQPRTTTG